MTKDYLSVEYGESSKPFTSYPEKFANYLVEILHIKQGSQILEVGAGRCEMAKAFLGAGMNVMVTDSSPLLEKYATESGLAFSISKYDSGQEFSPFPNVVFDVVFTKSFVEHIPDPVDFALKMKTKLKPGGLLVTLTPDWETNYWNFYDDLTHIKPFTEVTLKNLYLYSDFEQSNVIKVRQLPSTWHSRIMRILSILTSVVIPTRFRTTIKWIRWSRELMLVGYGTKR